jgi:hypothetical protein
MKPQPADGRRFEAPVRFSRVVLALLLTVAGISFAQMKPGDRRKAYGEPRASVMESLLTTLYPGAGVLWDPGALMVRLPGEKPRMVEVPVYVRGSEANGGLEGAATIELDGAKEQFIYEAQNFRRTDRPVFPTELIVFRANMAGRIERYKRLMLDPAEPLTELKTISIQDWSQEEWPTLEIHYDTHRVAPGSFTTIEWHGTFDANSGQFISRLPFGITRKLKGGPEQTFFFGIGRNSPTTVLITNRYGGETHQYDCSEQCVMAADTLLSEWNLSDLPTATAMNKGAANSVATEGVAKTGNPSPAIIHLKNGQTVHAETVNEAGDKVEYTVGESVYKIPKSLVQEIVHTGDRALQNDNPEVPAQSLSQSPAQTHRCKEMSQDPDPRIPCKIGFSIEVLMGLGETQRFTLFDDSRHNVTAQAHWTVLDNPSPDARVDFSVVDGVPTLSSKKDGPVWVYASLGNDSASVSVFILKPQDLIPMESRWGGRWGQPKFFDSRRPLQIVPAAPDGGRVH